MKQELETPVDGAKVGGGVPVRRLLLDWARDYRDHEKGCMDSVIHLPEPLAVVDTEHLA